MAEEIESIARLWDKITARIAEDGGVMHRSSFEQEVAEWLQPRAKTYSSGSEILAEMRLQEAINRAWAGMHTTSSRAKGKIFGCGND